MLPAPYHAITCMKGQAPSAPPASTGDRLQSFRLPFGYFHSFVFLALSSKYRQRGDKTPISTFFRDLQLLERPDTRGVWTQELQQFCEVTRVARLPLPVGTGHSFEKGKPGNSHRISPLSLKGGGVGITLKKEYGTSKKFQILN